MKERIKNTVEGLYNEARGEVLSRTGDGGKAHTAGIDAIVNHIYHLSDDKAEPETVNPTPEVVDHTVSCKGIEEPYENPTS